MALLLSKFMTLIRQLFKCAWVYIFVSFLFVFAMRSDLTHFTWWSILFFLCYAFWGIRSKESTLLWFIITIESIVIGGVMLMSTTECTLFKNTETDIGRTRYFFGNFSIHYLPLLIAIAFTKGSLLWNRRLSPDLSDIWTAFGVVCIYFTMYDPADVYGCTLSKNDLFIGSMVATVGVTFVRCIPELYTYYK